MLGEGGNADAEHISDLYRRRIHSPLKVPVLRDRGCEISDGVLL
jgi:hypothetical protein